MSQQFQTSRIFRSALDEKYYNIPHGALEANFKLSATLVDQNSRSTVDNVTILDTVLGLARPQYSLVQACRVEPTDTLEFNIDYATSKITANEKVGDLVRSPLKSVKYARAAFDLWKNEVPLAISDKKARQAHPTIQRDIEDAAKAIANSKNGQIKTVLESATRTSNGGDWNSTNPYIDINTAADSIENTYEAGEANCIAANRGVWTAFWSNPFVKGQLYGAAFPTSKVFTIPGLPGWTGIMDNAMSSEIAVVCDRSQFAILAQGPTESEYWRDADAGFDAYKIRDWMEVKKVVDNAGYKLADLLS